ncbi:Ldh family oxidoreductase [Spirochaeta isovalerica]|uniref:LDH2 family malate/lactate/ureidoglycolate dehydrogenase n=1 Tax=Spirochaeta isovalerica TaxID=150 RepID=A0A841R800_9SPIO|nr:Ldh family oxidoreductase [Spirochaeta isovalerica]MBB6479993.1 LDH2 family malate/lactate/ureidoglycolate dehydrogenase [Spirochaeta isovalerica]
MEHEEVRIQRHSLEDFCRKIFQQLGVSEENAATASEVLVAADAWGIPSHGTGRLWRYVNGLKSGQMLPDAPFEILRETPASLVINANGAMGAPVSVRAMNMIIDKAKTNGSAFGCVRGSNHFGIAGYYAKMALNANMIGIAMTNTAALGVPTFGRQVMFGTNPLAFAAPADKEVAFLLDMSTTVVTRGKVEVYERLDKELPDGWAVDKTGRPAKDARSMLDDMQNRVGGGLLPLGGMGKAFGGHKGFGLAVMVDILTGVLSGASFGQGVFDTEESSARVSHFFGAIDISRFRDPDDFRRDMDDMLREIRRSPPAEGEEQVYFAGLPEMEKERENNRIGVPLLKKTYEGICAIGKEQGIQCPEPISIS